MSATVLEFSIESYSEKQIESMRDEAAAALRTGNVDRSRSIAERLREIGEDEEAIKIENAIEAHKSARPEIVPLTRDQKRGKRKRLVRSKTINMKRTAKQELAVQRALFPREEIARNKSIQPKTRGECAGGLRPCPWLSCKHHLFLDIGRDGSIKYNFPDLEWDQLEESCVLDIADRNGATLEVVAPAMNLTRERVRQIEVDGMSKLAQCPGALADFVEEESPNGKRRLHVVQPSELLDEEDEDSEDMEDSHDEQPCFDGSFGIGAEI